MNHGVSLVQLRRSGVFNIPSCGTTSCTTCRNFVRIGNNPDTSAG